MGDLQKEVNELKQRVKKLEQERIVIIPQPYPIYPYYPYYPQPMQPCYPYPYGPYVTWCGNTTTIGY